VYPSEPERSSGDLNFPLFGIPVRIHPMFWLVSAVMGRSTDLKHLVAWVLAVFVAILIHELGHALVMTSFGFRPWITLYGFGGLTSRSGGGLYRSRGESSLAQIMISAAGPAAGFLLALVVALLLQITGHEVYVRKLAGFLPYVVLADQVGSPVLTDFIFSLLMVSVFWGAVNLLPIHPLDGGQIAREIIMRISRREGLRLSLVLSLVAAGAMALVSFFKFDDAFMGIFFLYLAVMSYVSLGGMMGRGR
jgi:membrane-associated protease RseP (regulator of RpoE activity)